MYMYQMYVQCIAHYILFMLTLLHLKCILLHMHYESVYIYMPVSNTGTLLYNQEVTCNDLLHVHVLLPCIT